MRKKVRTTSDHQDKNMIDKDQNVYCLSNIIVSTYNTVSTHHLFVTKTKYDKKLQISGPQQHKQEQLYLIYYNYSPNFAEGTTRIIDDLEPNQLIFKMQLPPGAEFVLPNLVLPTIVFLALGLGVGIGVVVSICSYSICLVKSKKKEEDIELDSSRFNSIDRRSLDRNRRTHHLVNPTPVVNKINVGVQKYPERLIPANPSAPGVVDYPKKQRSSSSHFFTIPESTNFFQEIFFVLFFYNVEAFY